MGATEYQPGSAEYAFTDRMIQLVDHWPWDETAALAARQLRIDMNPHLPVLLEQWLMTVHPTCRQGMDRVAAMWPDHDDSPMPTVLATLIDEAGDLQRLRDRGEPLIESLDDDDLNHLVFGLGRMLSETIRTVGGLAAYT